MSEPTNVTSGIGYFSGVITVSATPINIFGAIAADVSGRHGITDNSGALNVNISGGNLIANVSGNVVGIQSGAGPVVVQTSGTVVNVVIALSGGTALGSEGGSGANMRVSIWNAQNESDVLTGSQLGSDTLGNSAALRVVANLIANNGSNSDRIRTILGSSGAFLGVLATAPALWKYSLVSGATIINVYQSGAVALHAININSYSSGGQVEVRDSQSGVAGLVLGTISPTINTIANTDLPPASLNYDVLLTSGLVLSSSGAFWNMTVLWRNLTS